MGGGGGKGGGSVKAGTVSEEQIRRATEAFHNGAEAIADQFPLALSRLEVTLGQGTRDAIELFTEGNMQTMPFSETAKDALNELRQFTGLAPISKTSPLATKMRSLADQFKTVSATGTQAEGMVPHQLERMANQLEHAEGLQNPQEREQARQQVLSQFQELRSGINTGLNTWWNRSAGILTGDIRDESGNDITGLVKEAQRLYPNQDDLLKPGELEAGGTNTVAGQRSATYNDNKMKISMLENDLRNISTNPSMSTYNRTQRAHQISKELLQLKEANKQLEAQGISSTAASMPGELKNTSIAELERSGAFQKEDVATAQKYATQQDWLPVGTRRTEELERIDDMYTALAELQPELEGLEQEFADNYSQEAGRPFTSQEISDRLTQLPEYQFQYQQGAKALERSQAARGLLNSGQAVEEAQRFGQGLAESAYNAHIGRLSGLAGISLPLTQQGVANTQNQGATALNTGQYLGAQRQSSLQDVARAREQAFQLQGQGMLQAYMQNAQNRTSANMAGGGGGGGDQTGQIIGTIGTLAGAAIMAFT